MLRTMTAPPRLGSLRESLLLLALMMEENIEHAKFRASAQLQLDKEHGATAFEEYMKIAFPYLDVQKKRDREQYIQILQNEIKHGAIAVTPMMPTTLRSRIKERYQKRVQPMTRDQERALYDRLGRFNQ